MSQKSAGCTDDEKHAKAELVQVRFLLLAAEQPLCAHLEQPQPLPPPSLCNFCTTALPNTPFKTAGSLANSFASPSMCTSLPVINSLKRRLPRSLFWIEGDSSLLYCSYRSHFFPYLPFIAQIMLPGAVASPVSKGSVLFKVSLLLQPKRQNQKQCTDILTQPNTNIHTYICWHI